MTNTFGPSPTLTPYCQCGNEIVGLQTTNNTVGTTFIECGSTTTFSTITPTLNPTPTQSVKCFPTHGGNPITDSDKLVEIISPNVVDKCNGTVPKWEWGGSDSTSPSGNNFVTSGYITNDDAPDDCQHFYKGNLTPLQVDLCALPLETIIDACPYNGGTIETVCGKSYLTTCAYQGACVAYGPS